MTILANAYCTRRELPPLEFPHTLNGHRERDDPELLEHLDGFCGYVASRGKGMTATRFHVIQHIQRVRHHLSLEVEEDDLDAFAGWAAAANAVVFLPDGSVRAPDGATLVDAATGEPDEEAELPHPEDALARRTRTGKRLASLRVPTVKSLPPVVSEAEVDLRSVADVVARARALFVVAVRGESVATGEPLSPAQLRAKLGAAPFEALTPNERAFLDDEAPDEQAVTNATWRYEALNVLLWALGRIDDLPVPKGLCDVPAVARQASSKDEQAWSRARLRPTGELLDALDLHYRLHWAVTDARVNGKEAPAGLEPGVVLERHHALNWLVRDGDADWDDVQTAT